MESKEYSKLVNITKKKQTTDIENNLIDIDMEWTGSLGLVDANYHI